MRARSTDYSLDIYAGDILLNNKQVFASEKPNP